MKKVFIMLLMPIAMFMGCSKNNEPTPDGSKPDVEKNCGVSKITGGSNAIVFEYDDKGRVVFTEDVGDASYLFSDKFSYSENQIEVKGYENKKLISTNEYQLDKSGKITQAKSTYVPSADITNYAFTYNSDGYLVKVVSQGGIEMELNLVYDNGNLSARLLKYKNGQSWSEYNDEFTYTSEADYPYSSYFGNIFADYFSEFHKNVLYEQGHLGKKSKNRLADGIVYGEDSNGRVNEVSGEAWAKGTIHYLCDQ